MSEVNQSLLKRIEGKRFTNAYVPSMYDTILEKKSISSKSMSNTFSYIFSKFFYRIRLSFRLAFDYTN